MRIAVVGAGAIGGYLGARLSLRRRRSHLHRAGRESRRDPRARDAPHRGGRDAGARRRRDGDRSTGRGRSARRGPAHGEGTPGGRHRPGLASPVSRDDQHRHDAERHPLVVLPQARRRARRAGQCVSADPDGIIARNIDPARVIGSVVYPAANLIAPGVVQVVEGNRFTLGELDGATTPRVQAIAASLIKAGFKAPITRDIRSEIWLKLWGNLSFNPISALTHATLVDICQFPLTRELAAQMMSEAETIAEQARRRPSASASRSASPAPRTWARTRPRCCRTSSRAARSRSRRWSAAVVELGRLTGTPTPAHRRGVRLHQPAGEDIERSSTGRLKISALRHQLDVDRTAETQQRGCESMSSFPASNRPATCSTAGATPTRPVRLRLTRRAATPLTYRRLRALAARTLDTLNAKGVGPKRSRRHRARQRTGDGGRVPVHRRRRDRGAAQSSLSRRRVRVLSDRPQRQDPRDRAHDKASPAVEVAEQARHPDRAPRRPRPSKAPAPSRSSFPMRLTLPHAHRQAGAAAPDDIALVLHTSGTTSRPKIVPLAQQNVCASARNIRSTLALSAADRGLVDHAAVPHPRADRGAARAAVGRRRSVLHGGFNALKFFSWMAEVQPTWYTAVPTMHQTILPRAGKNADVDQGQPACASSARRRPRLPPQVIRELEEVFGAPVIESYGMTEAAHQMASNPLPPGKRKPGTVGIAAGPGGLRDRHRRQPAAGRRYRGDRDPRAERDARLREQSRRRTPRPSAMAGFAPAIRASWTRTATSPSPDG